MSSEENHKMRPKREELTDEKTACLAVTKQSTFESTSPCDLHPHKRFVRMQAFLERKGKKTSTPRICFAHKRTPIISYQFNQLNI